MKEYKVYVKDEETSVQVQKHAFNLGYRWPGEIEGEIRHTDFFILFNLNGAMLQYNSFFQFKHNVPGIELTPEEFLKLSKDDVIEKREFDIEPFDKVLVRDDDASRWRIEFFERRDSSLYICMNAAFRQIAKYTPELKKYIGYIGTTDDIPGAWKCT